jgi:hypothetical protein
MEITPNIHQINGVRGANCYLVIAGSKMMVIDTGLPGNPPSLRNWLSIIQKKNKFIFDKAVPSYVLFGADNFVEND